VGRVLPKIPLIVTTDLTELHPSKEFLRVTGAKADKKLPAWFVVGALGALAGAGYAAVSLFGKPPPPAPGPNLGAAVAVAAPKEAKKPAQRLTDNEQAPAPGESDSEALEQLLSETTVVPSEVEDASDANAKQVQYATEGAFYVQVASYRTKENADTRAEELKQRSMPAQSVAYGGPEAGWWHAVRLGPFKTRSEAEERRFDLERSERIHSYVLPRSNGKYHVQVASFSKSEDAEPVAQRFAAQGHQTKVSRVRMNGKHWYCVRIGPFDSEEEAKGYQKLVDNVPGTKSTVIPFGPPPAAAAD
jgi:cell division protein FtsN